ncbi:hypothetical protein HGRIS_001388 [Hohenbuehelia grisea]|uniref:Uncharacterized protein n=1 Tax=Hohenbuehelia grisea TaxID=104357 RepID=A0ABR3JP66_9AGAR
MYQSIRTRSPFVSGKGDFSLYSMLADIEPPSVIAFADFGRDFRRSIDPEKGHSSYILPSSEDYEALFSERRALPKPEPS